MTPTLDIAYFPHIVEQVFFEILDVYYEVAFHPFPSFVHSTSVINSYESKLRKFVTKSTADRLFVSLSENDRMFELALSNPFLARNEAFRAIVERKFEYLQDDWKLNKYTAVPALLNRDLAMLSFLDCPDLNLKRDNDYNIRLLCDGTDGISKKLRMNWIPGIETILQAFFHLTDARSLVFDRINFEYWNCPIMKSFAAVLPTLKSLKKLDMHLSEIGEESMKILLVTLEHYQDSKF